ncbi:hypothetical protein SLEP1_g2807 [Rubroshorea leprosula]|uniref:Pectinesterase inhibitor domain-containing protein n=1 Tax=Rubroshorea leprosula TaxID=152421 RepID=A0AAV5HPW2_9ROSI|nr:hypothetical protein SLEP1_g2807 [Rubroshorea leprosula]
MFPSFSFTLFLLIIFTSFLTIVPAHNLIHQTCKKCAETDPNIRYNFCASSLHAAPQAHCADNLRQLGIISLRLLRRNVTQTRSHIKEILHDRKLDPFIRSCLLDCFDLYSNAVPLTRKAIKEYRGKRYYNVNIDVSAVMDTPTTCEDGFKEKEGAVSPLTKRDNDNFELSAISLSIINMLSP